MRKCMALLAAGLLALGVAAPAGAATEPLTGVINGYGALALWTTAPLNGPLEPDTPYIDTGIFIHEQWDAPGPRAGTSRTSAGGALFWQTTWHLTAEGDPVIDLDSWAESYPDPTMVFQQPLASASGSVKDVERMTCEGSNCWPDDPISFDIAFTGVGPIDRLSALPEVVVVPGVSVELTTTRRIDTAIREVAVDLKSYSGFEFPTGSEYVEDPMWRSPVAHGSRIFWVHHAFMRVCIGGAWDWVTWSCVPS